MPSPDAAELNYSKSGPTKPRLARRVATRTKCVRPAADEWGCRFADAYR
jgi:hypothetical protein